MRLLFTRLLFTKVLSRPLLPPISVTSVASIKTLILFSFRDKTTHNYRKFSFTLSPTNYRNWKAMIQPFFSSPMAYSAISMAQFVNPLPQYHQQKKNVAPIPNPSYLIRLSNDTYVWMLLMYTIFEAAFQHVYGTTSHYLWLYPEWAYAPHKSSIEYTLKT